MASPSPGPRELPSDAPPSAAVRPRAHADLAITPFNSAGRQPRFILHQAGQDERLLTGEVGVSLIGLLDGSRTLEQLEEGLAARLGKRISAAKIESFLDLCDEKGILEPGTWREPDQRPARKPRRRAGFGYHRHLFRADGLLAWLTRHRRAWLNPVTGTALGGLLFAGIAMMLFPPEGGGLSAPLLQLRQKGPDWILLLLPLVILVEVSLHELSHALAVYLFGARSRGFGFGLLWHALPVFFTDTTDAYRIDSKYKRALVSAAGPIVDLAFLGICGLLAWFLPESSGLRRFAIGYSAWPLSALLVNLNPLLIRMDGYWILADLVERPDLRRASLRHLRAEIDRLRGRFPSQGGLESPLETSWRARLFYGAYALVAIAWTAGFIGLFLLALARALGQAFLEVAR